MTAICNITQELTEIYKKYNYLKAFIMKGYFETLHTIFKTMKCSEDYF